MKGCIKVTNIKRNRKNTPQKSNTLGIRLLFSLIIAAAVLCVKYIENPNVQKIKSGVYYIVKSDFKTDDCTNFFHRISSIIND